MSEEKKYEFDHSWFDVWMKQSKQFFESAQININDLFSKNGHVRPEEHMQQIKQWLDHLKAQWQFIELTEQQKNYANYWQQMEKMCHEAIELMMHEWTKRAKENHPIKSLQELYELWLECCHEVYKKSMHSKSYQEIYGDFMNAALKYWQSVLPK